jgi:hypothetical protein
MLRCFYDEISELYQVGASVTAARSPGRLMTVLISEIKWNYFYLMKESPKSTPVSSVKSASQRAAHQQGSVQNVGTGRLIESR